MMFGVLLLWCHTPYKYFFIFIDDYSRFTSIYFLLSKSEVFQVFLCWESIFHHYQNSWIRFWGWICFLRILEFFTTKKELSPNDPFWQNGVSERKNRHLLDVVHCLLLESFMLTHFLPEALSIAVHLINRLSSSIIENQTPYFRLFNKQPKYSHLHMFGCVYIFFSSTLRVHQTNISILQMCLPRICHWSERVSLLWSLG